MYADFTLLNTDLLALVAEIVGILGHSILEWLLVELGGGGGDLVTLHLVLILKTEHALALYVLIQLGYRLLYITQGRVGDGDVLGKRRGVTLHLKHVYSTLARRVRKDREERKTTSPPNTQNMQ